MSVVSFEDWKSKKARSAAFTKVGVLREDVALKEQYGFDLCVFISEELSGQSVDLQRAEQLKADLEGLMAQLPHEHAYFYFKAYQAFLNGDLENVVGNFDKYLKSEKDLYNELAPCDWFIDSLMWVFMPPLPGMYGKIAELFFKYWPLCSMGLALEAIEMSENDLDNVDAQLDMLMLAITADEKCYLAHYVIATLFTDIRMFKSALAYFEKAAGSGIYSCDPSFYFDYAWAAEKAQEYNTAIVMYNSVLALDESYPCTVNNLGCVYMAKGEYDKAMALFNKAINTDADGILPYKNIVVLLKKTNKLDECVEFIEKHSSVLGAKYNIEAAKISEAKNSGEIFMPNFANEPLEEDTDDAMLTKRFIENRLENFVTQGKEVFGRNLSIYQDENGYGMSYYVPGGGRIDMLCTDNSEGLYAIAVYPQTADERSALKMWQQLSAIRKNMASKLKKLRVFGIICCCGATDSLKSIVAALPFESVEIYELDFSLTKIR